MKVGPVWSRLTALAVVIGCAACMSDINAQALKDVAPSLARCRPLQEIPFESYGDLIFLQARVNGSAPMKFILDTGAFDNYLFTDRADELGLQRQGRATRYGAGENPYEIAFAMGATLNIAGVKLTNQEFAITRNSLGYADGIIGYAFFDQFVVEIDYETRRINLYPRQCEFKAAPNAVVPLSFEVEARIPTVHARIAMPGRQAVVGRLIVDTGAGAFAKLTRPFTQRHKFLETDQRFISVATAGLGGRSTSEWGRAKSFQVGSFVFQNPIVGFFQDRKGFGSTADYDGLLGNALLSRFKVVFDYSRKRMILQPNARFKEPFEFDMSGLHTQSDAKNTKMSGAEKNLPGDNKYR